jgi:hypothetical protein
MFWKHRHEPSHGILDRQSAPIRLLPTNAGTFDPNICRDLHSRSRQVAILLPFRNKYSVDRSRHPKNTIVYHTWGQRWMIRKACCIIKVRMRCFAQLLLLGSFASAAAVENKAPKGFVTREGETFKLDGKNFYFAGSNAYYLPFNDVRAYTMRCRL